MHMTILGVVMVIFTIFHIDNMKSRGISNSGILTGIR